jgi:hypothetical protein
MPYFMPPLACATLLPYLDPGPLVSRGVAHALLWVVALILEAVAVLTPNHLVRRSA